MPRASRHKVRSAPRAALVLAASTGIGLVLSACGTSPSSDPTAPPPKARATASPTVFSGRATKVVPLEDRLRSRLRVASPDGIIEADDSIWVKTDDGHLVRVNPKTDEVRSILTLDSAGLDPSRYCQGVGTDGRSVWTCATGAKTTRVVRIDPATDKVVETFDVDKSFDQVTLPFAFDRMWVLTGDGSTLRGLHAGRPAAAGFAVGARCAQVAPTEDALVLTCPLDDTVRRIDTDTGKTLAKVTLRHPFIAHAAGDSVWVGSTDGLQRLDAHTLTATAVYPRLSPELAGDIAATQDDVWVRVQGGFLFHIDPRTGEVTEQVADAGLSGGSILVTDHAVWATANDDDLLLRVAH